MCFCREVRFSAILLSCIGVLHGGTGASRTEAAAHSSDSAKPTTCSFPCVPNNIGGSDLSIVHSRTWTHPDDAAPAMAIPDGPGAVCFGIMGFLCVALVKNRRIWISLCLFALSSGRMGLARLSRTNVPGPDSAAPDSSTGLGAKPTSDGASPYGTWRVSNPWSDVSLRIPRILRLGPAVRPTPLDRLRDDSNRIGSSPFMDGMPGGPQADRFARVQAGTLKRPASGMHIERARPPPERFSLP